VSKCTLKRLVTSFLTVNVTIR